MATHEIEKPLLMLLTHLSLLLSISQMHGRPIRRIFHSNTLPTSWRINQFINLIRSRNDSTSELEILPTFYYERCSPKRIVLPFFAAIQPRLCTVAAIVDRLVGLTGVGILDWREAEILQKLRFVLEILVGIVHMTYYLQVDLLLPRRFWGSNSRGRYDRHFLPQGV